MHKIVPHVKAICRTVSSPKSHEVIQVSATDCVAFLFDMSYVFMTSFLPCPGKTSCDVLLDLENSVIISKYKNVFEKLYTTVLHFPLFRWCVKSDLVCYCWFFQVILMQRRLDGNGVEQGLYTLSSPYAENDSSHMVAFEDRSDATNFCYLVQSFFEDLEDFTAEIVPLSIEVRTLS